MLMTLVLTRSYAGNLISHLAVRYIPKPYVNLRELVDDKSGGIIWQQDSSTEQYIRSKEMGILKEVADLEQKGRARRIPVKEFYSSIDNFVKRGDHVIILYDEFLSILLGQQFSNTGRCDLYLLKDKIKPSMAGMMVPKDSPFLPPFNDRALAINEFGLYEYWIQSAIPNYTACLDPPTKISVSNSLSISNLWGIFVVLFGGFFVSLIFLGFETLL
ncbi:Ionotropic receptor 93a-like 17 [Homarus americanus]|uniref:Ionotropic receptor 93a-like 17 n=2 Tax=Homarus americanus TaxID=6706 RepID=A0A8J5JQS4_HOMAM|nr:Ionotropic receptor 93a-like 17 [Homarus americanus]